MAFRSVIRSRNGRSETGYRWHDALHLAHAACLDWSPVLRSLAGLKRRSDSLTGHFEDGGQLPGN